MTLISELIRRSLRFDDLRSAPGNAERVALLPNIMYQETLMKFFDLERNLAQLIAAEKRLAKSLDEGKVVRR